MRRVLFFLTPASCLLLPAAEALACSVCFGDPNSQQSKALGASVLFLLGTVGSVLGGILYFIFQWARRAKKLSETIAKIA